MCLAKGIRTCLVAVVNDVTIHLQVLAPESSRRQHHTASRIEGIPVWDLSVLVEEAVECPVSQLVQALRNHMNAEIMVVAGSKSSQMAGRGVQVLLVVDYLEETPLGKRDCGLLNMVIEPVDLEVVLNRTSCSKEVIAHGVVCD
jgi:hypothetical protein